MLSPFHLAVQVRDIAESREFYGEKLGFSEGRSDTRWVDFDFFGHQFVVHLNPELGPSGRGSRYCNPVDEQAVPVPHFGIVLSVDVWKRFAARVEPLIDAFIIEPYVRFEGKPGEQCTMFFEDPSGNALEFKAFANVEKSLFATA